MVLAALAGQSLIHFFIGRFSSVCYLPADMHDKQTSPPLKLNDRASLTPPSVILLT